MSIDVELEKHRSNVEKMGEELARIKEEFLGREKAEISRQERIRSSALSIKERQDVLTAIDQVVAPLTALVRQQQREIASLQTKVAVLEHHGR